MAQFDLYSYGQGYLLDVQSDLMDGLNIRMCVPLLPPDQAPKPAHRLNPVFVIGDDRFVMATQYMGSVPVAKLGASVATLAAEDYLIKSAVDMLFDGF